LKFHCRSNDRVCNSALRWSLLYTMTSYTIIAYICKFDRNPEDPTNERTVRQKKKQIVTKENRVLY